MDEFRHRLRKAPADASVTVLDIEGSLDSYTSEKLQDALKQLFQAGSTSVVLNLQGLKYMSSAGIGLVVEQMEIARGRQGDLKLANVPAKIGKVLDMCGASKLLEVWPSEDEAVSHFSHRRPGKEAINFPREAQCPACGQSAPVPAPDLYKCALCGEVLDVNHDGAVVELKSSSGTPPSGTRRTEVTVPSDLSFIHSIKMFVKHVLMKGGLEEDLSNDVELAIDEALTNIVEHGYRFDPTQSIRFSLAVEKDRLMVTIVDQGKSYAPKETVTEEVVDDLSKRLRRGRGQLLIKKLMDEVSYRSEGGTNTLTLVKYRKKEIRAGFIPLAD